MTLVIKCTPHLQLSIHDLKLKYCKICFLLFRVEWSVLRMTAAIVKGLHRVPLEHVPPPFKPFFPLPTESLVALIHNTQSYVALIAGQISI